MPYELRLEVNLDVAKNDITPEQVRKWAEKVLREATQPGEPGHYFALQSVLK